MKENSNTRLIRQKADEFLLSRKNSNKLIDILEMIQEGKESSKDGILAVERIFFELGDRGELNYCNFNQRDQTSDSAYYTWVLGTFNNTQYLLFNVILKQKSDLQVLALSTIMKLLSLEGKFILKPQENKYCFPVKRLQNIIPLLVPYQSHSLHLISCFAEHLNNHDLVYYTWKVLSKTVNEEKNPTEVYIKNYLSLIDKMIIPSIKPGKENEVSTQLLCSREGSIFIINLPKLRMYVTRVWNCIVRWKHSFATHRQLLFVLLERMLDHLDNAPTLTGYLLDSMNLGGAVSILALQGLFVLMQKHNIEYPNVYAKLYSLFQPDIFHMKYKSRLFHLSDIFLSSTHLPESLVAAFAKRLSRLTFWGSAADICLIIYFIGNLLLRHPGLQILINHPSGKEVDVDPFDMNEADPLKSRAMESSLWEIQALQNHVLPSVATAARIINSPLPKIEWDLSSMFQDTDDEIFCKEFANKSKVELTYSKPNNISLHQGEKLMKYWTFEHR